jgi:hypothetical protein
MRHRCREISSLVLQSQDRPLRWYESVKVRLHLGMCSACSRFASQMRFMSQALETWRQQITPGSTGDKDPRG